MSSLLKTKAIVLSQMPIKDQDKRIVLFSMDFGKMIVFANGARRGKSPLLAGTQPFVFGEFHVLEGRDSYTLKHVDIIETFYALREDLDDLSYGLYLLEITQHVTSEMDPNEELLRLLYISLMAIKTHSQPMAVIRRIFEFRCLCQLGYSPDLSDCSTCHKEPDQYLLSSNGGLFCNQCHGVNANFSHQSLEILRFIQNRPLNKLFHFIIEPERFTEIEQVVESYFKSHITERFKSLDILQ